MTAIELAQILHEEFDRDDWGEIDPYLFQFAAESEENPNLLDAGEYDHAEETVNIIAVLERVVARIRAEIVAD